MLSTLQTCNKNYFNTKLTITITKKILSQLATNYLLLFFAVVQKNFFNYIIIKKFQLLKFSYKIEKCFFLLKICFDVFDYVCVPAYTCLHSEQSLLMTIFFVICVIAKNKTKKYIYRKDTQQQSRFFSKKND